MSATAAQIAELRRLVAEPTTTTYSDETLASYIERYALVDKLGREPFVYNVPPFTSSSYPVASVNAEWVPTYDLNHAAADIWQEKAAALAGKFDFSSDGQSFSVSQKYDHAQQQARYYLSRRSIQSIEMEVVSSVPPVSGWPGTGNEQWP